MKLSPLTKRRISRFRKNKRAFYSLIIFSLLFILSLFAEIIVNDKPIVLSYQDKLYFPIFFVYTEKEFGGFFDTEADYKDPFMLDIIDQHGWAIWTPVRFSYNTVSYNILEPPPTKPTLINPLGLDDQGRDVFARLLYGFRLSVIFGFMLTTITSIIGIFVGAIQGYYGGKIDLYSQRFMEILSGIPMLYLLIIASSLIRPGFWWLLLLMSIFGWMSLVGVVRAEFFRGRELEYVKAARALGVKDFTIMFRHILPNALVSAMTFFPFILAGSVTVLTSLDFLGFGMPPGSPSLGEILAAGKSNIHAPWVGISAFVLVSSMLTLLVFIGEGFRDSFDPKHLEKR